MVVSNEVAPITQALRGLVQQRKLLISSTAGLIVKLSPGATGQKAKGEKEDVSKGNILTEKGVQQHIKQNFPHYPIFHVDDPKHRAITLKKNGSWTQETADEAMRCFMVPPSQKGVLIWPDYADRNELQKHEQYKVKDKDGDYTGGVKTICPYCKKNDSVDFLKWECQNYKTAPRKACGSDASTLPLCAPRLYCRSFDCCGPVPDGELVHDEPNKRIIKYKSVTKDKRSGKEKINDVHWEESVARAENHSFVLWSQDCFNQYPESVKSRYGRYIYGLERDVNDPILKEEPQTLPTPDFADTLLDPLRTFSGISAELYKKYLYIRNRAEKEYQRFVEDYGENKPRNNVMGRPIVMPTVKWKAFDRNLFDEENKPPGEAGIKTIFWFVFKQIEKYLDRDLYSRLPGPFVRYDGNYKLANKILEDIQVGETPGVLGLVTGTYGHIIIWALMNSEEPSNWSRLHYFIQKRCEERGHTYMVKGGWSDTCCDGLDDPTEHDFVKIYPAVTRAPLKDLFHAYKLVTDNTDGGHHPLHEVFCQEFKTCTLKYLPDSIKAAIKEYKRLNPDLNPDAEDFDEVAISVVMTEQEWKQRMYNGTVAVDEAVPNLEAFWERAEKLNQEYMDQGYRDYFRKQTPTQQSTKQKFDNFITHLKKGCYTDPLPPEQMSFPLDDAIATNVEKPVRNENDDSRNRLPILGRLRGTNTVEASNKVMNKVSRDMSRFSQDLAAAKLKLRIHDHNLKKDKKFGAKCTPRIKSKSIIWYLEEANYLHSKTIDHLETNYDFDGVFPPDDGRWEEEPVGAEFLRYKHWKTVEQNLFYADRLRAAATTESNEEDTPTNLSMDSIEFTESDFQRFDLQVERGHRTTGAARECMDVETPDATSTDTASPDATSPDTALPDTTSPDATSPIAASPDTASPIVASLDTASPIVASPNPTSPDAVDPVEAAAAATASLTLGTSSSSRIKVAGRRHYPSSGGSKWNRKESRRSIPPPSHFTLKYPLNSHQYMICSSLMSEIVSSGDNRQNQTIPAMSAALMKAWNAKEANLVWNLHQTMGGLMTMEVATKLVKKSSLTYRRLQWGGASMNMTQPAGLTAISQQPVLLPANPSPQILPVPVSLLTEEDVKVMKYRPIKDYLIACGLPVGNTLPKRRDELLKYLQEKQNKTS